MVGADTNDPHAATPRQKGRDAAALRTHAGSSRATATAEYREWLGKLIIEIVRIAQQGAGNVYGIAERVLTTAGLEGVQPPRSSAAGSANDGTGS